LLLKYPLEVSAITEVLLPSTWPISDSDARVDDPAFSFRRSVRADPGHRRFVIHDEYRSLSDEVAAREMPRYTANLAKARGELGYSLDWSDALPPPVALSSVVVAGFVDRINWSMALMTAFALLLFTNFAIRAWQYDPAPRGPVEQEIAGFGGWLWLYTLGVLLMPVRLAMQLWENSPAYGSVAWSARTLFGGTHYHALNAPVLLFEWLGLLALLVASLLLLGLYFARRSSYPRLAVAFYVLAFTFQLGDLLLAARLPGLGVEATDLQSLAKLGLGALAWSAYLLGSRRVCATFVRRWRPAPPPVPAAAGAMMVRASA